MPYPTRDEAYARGVQDAQREREAYLAWDAAGRPQPRPYTLASCPWDDLGLFGMWVNGFTDETKDLASRGFAPVATRGPQTAPLTVSAAPSEQERAA